MASICHHLFSFAAIKNFLTPTHNYGTRAPELYNKASVWLGRVWLGLVGSALSVSVRFGCVRFDWGRAGGQCAALRPR